MAAFRFRARTSSTNSCLLSRNSKLLLHFFNEALFSEHQSRQLLAFLLRIDDLMREISPKKSKSKCSYKSIKGYTSTTLHINYALAQSSLQIVCSFDITKTRPQDDSFCFDRQPAFSNPCWTDNVLLQCCRPFPTNFLI